MDDNFWAESECSIPGERKVARRKYGGGGSGGLFSKWKGWRFRTPNRGRYDVTQQRTMTVRRLASAIFWLCPAATAAPASASASSASKKSSRSDSSCEAVQEPLETRNSCNYQSKAEQRQREPPPPDRSSCSSFSATFTKKVFRRKYRPSLGNIRGGGGLFEPYESFLETVSTTRASVQIGIFQ